MKPSKSKHDLIDTLLAYLSTIESDSPICDTFWSERKLSAKDTETAIQIKNFIDEIPGGFLVYSAEDEQILYANKALINIFGCDGLEDFKALTGNSFRGIVYYKDLEAVEESIAEQIAASDDNLDYVEYRIIAKDGSIHWVEDFGHYVQSDLVGNIFYVFITDTTEKVHRRLAEKAALISAKQEEEQKYKSIIEEYDKERSMIRAEHLRRLEVIEGLSVNYETILYGDMESDTILPYRTSSRLSALLKNKANNKLSTLLTNYVKKWVHPEDRKTVSERTSPEYIRAELSKNPTYYLNYRCIQNGETKYLQLRIANVSGSDAVSQIVLGYRSVDEEALQEMKQKQILEQALSNAKAAEVARNTFLSNMSHDLRTPLNALFGYTALAKKNAENSDAVKSYLDKIDESARNMLELIEKVLAVTYMESRDFKISECKFDVSDIVKDTAAALGSAASKKDIRINIEANIKHYTVYGDAEKVKQVLLHIGNNAVKYTDRGGNVRIKIVELENLSNEIAVYKFIISDTGIGISPDALTRIFEPFEREKNTTYSGEFGAGLGLTISQHLAEMMGGSITVESELNKGSVFTVTLGFRLQDASKSEKAKSGKKDLRGRKILLVEDNEINLEIETEILQDLGFIVDTAENGQIAVDKIKNSAPHEYAIILMDIQMPVMDGREATKAIRALENPELSNIPIVALSANALESDKRLSAETGMNDHLAKPIDIPVLIKAIERFL